ncbi:MAG: PP2C family protein-serine/threonine phosphatase [Spirochaetota bacterium]
MKLIRIISGILLLAGFFILNTYFFNIALEFSRIYPFKRILVGNILTRTIDISDSEYKFKTKLIKIENEAVNDLNVTHLLTTYSAKPGLKVQLESEGRIYDKIVKKSDINSQYLLFLLFLILIGNIHYLWGGIVYIIRPHEIRSKLFLLFSLSVGFFYYAIVERFTYGSNSLIFIVAVLVMGFLGLRIGSNLTNQSMSKIIFVLVLSFASNIIIYGTYIINTSGNPDAIVYAALLLYLLFTSSFTLYRLIYSIINSGYSFVIWRNVLLLICFFIGYTIPVLNILFSIFFESGIPLYLSSGLSLLFPLITGNSLLRYNQYGFSGYKMLQRNDFKIFAYSILTSVLSAVLLYSVFVISGSVYYKILYDISIVFIILMLFNVQRLLVRNIKILGEEHKDSYAFASQKIAELGSSSVSIEEKLRHIYREISGLTGAESLKLLLFTDIENDYYLNLSDYIEIMPKNSDLFSLINKNKDIILKHALVRNSLIENRIYDFFEAKNFVFLVPMIENNEVKGAFLIGKKRYRGFYLDQDIHFFQSVMYQIIQLIEIDRLYKDYIIKKQYEKELDNASYVQLRLFPKAALKDRGIDINFFYRPYLRVIGDYFDFFKVDKDRTAVIIGDVSGHGLSTAMVLSAVNSITHAILGEKERFEKTFTEINNYLNNSYRGIELITLFIGIFNRKTKVMEYINAGHGAPILIRKNEKKIRHIEGRSKILGADPDAVYTASRITLDKDDELILYTDGVMEIYNEKTGPSLDEEMFLKIILDNIEKDVNGKIIEIEKRIKFYSKDIKDDITIIGVKVH